MDFTIDRYRQLLKTLRSKNYECISFAQYMVLKKSELPTRFVILRHDVDKFPFQSLVFARIERELNISGTFYFRAVDESWDEHIITEISSMGHEVGYHYENLNTCNGDMAQAVQDFELHLNRLKSLVPVETICMHGSPTGKFDNKDLWKSYDYRMFEISGEPYLDTDFDKVFYLSDTGRRWDGFRYSIRDVIPQQKEWKKMKRTYRTTREIINAIHLDTFPDNVMFTLHPQRWHEPGFLWIQEYVLQNIKNAIKYFVNRL